MIYAINRKTKEHRVVDASVTYVEWDKWTRVEADADGWIEWRGGECPLPEAAKFDYKMRDGRVVCGRIVKADEWWGSPIIAYRPILDTKPETPEWRGPQDGNPPAGTPVSARTKECDSAAMVLANDHNIVVVRYESGMGFKYGGFDLSDVRPIRSAEDESVEEMAEAIRAFGHLTLIEKARALYRAGYRKTGGE